jgi:3-methyladenine DNA glycosylase AlkD
MDNYRMLSDIQKELETNIDPSPRVQPDYYFKEKIKYHGVKTAVVDRIARERYQQIKHLDKKDIFALCSALFETDYMEEAFVACDWAYRLRDKFEPADFELFQEWLNKYINNWAKCDTLCNHTIAAFVEKYPEFVERLKDWTQSENRWLRRAAAVTLILPARKGMFLKDVFEVANKLFLDKDDLVQKGYGWMLKEASKLHQQEVFDYILYKKAVMPRTALRYAIEKMPPEFKKRAMERTKGGSDACNS